MDAFNDMSAMTMAALFLISLVAGVGITAIGPGGVLVTIALFLLTDLSPAEIAGTAIVTHIGTGVVGSLAYIRSGQLRDPATRRLALTLCIAAVIATPIGVLLNTRMPEKVFGLLLAALVMVTGLFVLVREQRCPENSERTSVLHDWLPQAFIGGGVAIISGIFGLGGPMIAVPAMVLLGLPMLQALGSAQAQSIVLASIGTLVYFSQGAIIWPLVVLTGIPQMIGVLIGWKVAHTLPRRLLTYTLAVSLIGLGLVIVLMR